jgi:EAL domain-containing protein (putative c-di-GMP-specific phosphodiesterase class I)/DNA-binding response OmpR family regulator
MSADPKRALPVLVADDDETLRRLYVRALERAGFATREAKDGFEALQRIETEEIGLVLLDIHMPGVDGVTIVERLRADERTRTLPVILFTGTADLSERIRGLQAGADDYVLKTADVGEVVARIGAHVRSRAAWTDELARELASRTRVLAALADVVPAATPEETAARLVERLAAQPGVDFVSILSVEDDRVVSPLAGWKAGFGAWSGGPDLAASSSGHLLACADRGPWVEVDDATGADHTGRFAPAELGPRCFVPLRQHEELLGILVVASKPDEPGSTTTLLAETIDFAAVATAILAPALAARRRTASDRREVEEIIEKRAFSPLFQPLARLADRRVLAYEALTRFTDGVRPDRRFREAVRLGLGQRLEEETIAEIIRRAVALPKDRLLGLNVTPKLILDPGWLVALAERTTRRLVLELTEHAEVEDYDELRRALAPLQPRFDLAVDDAGAGYASLRHILELRPRYVKLDMALVRGIESDPMRRSLVAGLEHCVREMGGTTIAEGVETEAEAEALARLGVTVGQGYLFGRPAPAATWARAG